MPYTVLTDRLGTTLPDFYTLDGVVPEHLRTNNRFMEFMEAYLEWQQANVYSPANIINRLVDVKNIDNVAEEFIPYIQRAIAKPIPDVAGVDRRKLYKQIVDLYLAKGSLPSYEALFNILYKDPIELYFPRVDMLRPSSGNWNNDDQRYLDNGGFLSDRKKLQDSYYYQDYSYVIKTSKTYEAWKDIVTKVLHPAGFIFFGEINIVSIPDKKILKTRKLQPGRASAADATRPIIADVVSSRMSIALLYRSLLGNYYTGGLVSKAALAIGPTFKHLDQYKFITQEFASKYGDIVLEGPCLGLKTNIMPSVNQAQLDAGYANSTILLANFLYTQPADLGAGSYNDVIDLTDPITEGTIVIVDLQ